jgi:divalent metal cation (Fe/Co/Zn/Cd) transporter
MFVNLRIGIRRMTPFQLADGLVHRVEAALHAAIPDADILIHPEPVETADETMAEKIKLMMSEEGLIAHDVQVFKVNGKSQVEFQLEFDQEDFLRVHEAVTKIENRIKAALPDIGLVVIHIEDSREKVVESVGFRGADLQSPGCCHGSPTRARLHHPLRPRCGRKILPLHEYPGG